MFNLTIPFLLFLSIIDAQIALPTFQAVHKPHTAVASSLYDFTTHTFTNCGATGRNGPTLANCISSYNTSWENNTDYFNVPSDAGIQNWTVPTTGTYTIEVWGAQGGRSNEGYGARMRGNFVLTSETVLKILIGQQGGEYSLSASGGGGTFVVKSDNTPLIVAGGGGAHRNPSTTRRETTDGDTLEDGRSGYTNSSLNNGGTSGGGGTTTYTGSHGGGGGGGFTGNGDASNDTRGSCSPSTNQDPKSFSNGGIGGWSNLHNSGGNCSSPNRFGGFGGGAAGGWGGAGGGGGYSGGGSDHNTGWSGGGGSYNSGSTQSNSIGVNSGHGKVVITIN